MAQRRHGYSPQGQAKLAPWVTSGTAPVIPVETNSYPAAKAEEPKVRLEKQPPAQALAGLLKRIRIPQEAQRILANCHIPVVSLERLNVRAALLSSSLQPVVSLVRLPRRTEPQISCDPDQQNSFGQEPTGPSDPGVVPCLWTEPPHPHGSAPEEREQDSGLDCESTPEPPYILCDSGSEDWDPGERAESGMFYLDPDPDQGLVIQLDPEPQMDRDLDAEAEMKCEDDLIQVDKSEDQRFEEVDLCSGPPEPGPDTEEADGAEPAAVGEPGPVGVDGPGPEERAAGARPEGWKEVDSEDFCGVCLTGGELLCCDRCPKVYHLRCHLPPLTGLPQGDWMCTLCRTDQEPANTYACESAFSRRGGAAPYTLSDQEQRRCEKLVLQLYSHRLSGPFHQPVSPLARNYYQIIRRPVDLSAIRRKLDRANTLHYFSVDQFLQDVLLMLKNCATFNYPDSEVAQAGRNLEVFFLSRLREVFPDRRFPAATQETMNRARQRWLRKKERCRRKRYSFRGPKPLP